MWEPAQNSQKSRLPSPPPPLHSALQAAPLLFCVRMAGLRHLKSVAPQGSLWSCDWHTVGVQQMSDESMNQFMVEWLGRGARPCKLCQLGLREVNYAGASWKTESTSSKIQTTWSVPPLEMWV